MSKVKFRPVRGPEATIKNAPISEGYVYFATDTGKLYIDANGIRIPMGASGAAILYGNAEQLPDPDEFGQYTLSTDIVEGELSPKVGDLIINSNGAFLKVLDIDTSLGDMVCSMIAVSGVGGGGGSIGGGSGIAKGMSFRMGSLVSYTLINGQKMGLDLTATSAQDAEGNVLDDTLNITWTLQENGVTYQTGTITVDSGVTHNFEFGSKLRENATSTLLLQASGINSGTSKIYTVNNLKTVELTLQQHTNFTSNVVYNSSVAMYCMVSGAVNKVLEYFIDGDLVHTSNLGTAVGTQTFTATNVPHGHHKIRIQLTQLFDNGSRGVTVQPIEFEIAVNAGESTPIVWLGDYNEVYYSYDSIKIPFTVFNPNASSSVVRFYKGISELPNSPRTAANNVQQILEITNAEVGMINTYFIRFEDEAYASAHREISFNVEEDTIRTNYKLQYPENLMINFDATGRSNDESEVNREIWNYEYKDINGNKTVYEGKFKNFNWYNNGWILDEDNNTCLRISNGAQFSIPFEALDMNTSTSGKQSIAFEFQFKVRNVQDYSTLIKEITRYPNDGQYWLAFKNEIAEGVPIENEEDYTNPGYDNYDQFLQWYCIQIGEDYDTITNIPFGSQPTIMKEVTLNATFCQYYDKNNGIGLCLGPQDGFFATGSNTVSAKYVEDKMTNLTAIFSYNDKRIYFYLNGVLTAVTNVSSSGKITINSNEIVFNSEYCDLDLYKFRVYNTSLDVAAVDINYAVDRRDVKVYDHTSQLAQYNTILGEYQFNYEAMLEYNANNPDEYLMPYLIIETGPGDMLPYSKANKKAVGMEFVNVPLDRAYQTGELDRLAAEEGYKDDPEGYSAVQQYYHDHCPSWKGTNINFAVQGTSSEFYPRRNYKAKTKDSNDNINMYMNRGPFAAMYQESIDDTQLEFFHMNNKSVGTTKFTLKVDYMESSGTYNMGFANLVATAYTKHPIKDYNDKGCFQKIVYTLDSASEPTPNVTYYSDSKGKNKVKFSEEIPYVPNTFYKTEYEPYEFSKQEVLDFRTSVHGFPVLTFWKDADGNMTFIGRYNMLLDKGSDEAFGFKPSKSIVQKYNKNKTVRKTAQCWEFSNNNRTYCSFRDPQDRYELDFLPLGQDGTPLKNSKGSCPIVTDSFEFRYHDDEDILDYIYDPNSVSPSDYQELMADYGEDYGDISNFEVRTQIMEDTYNKWQKAVKWVYSTCVDNVPSLGTYRPIDDLGEALYQPGEYYIYDNSEYKLSNEEFDAETTYFKVVDNEYISVPLASTEDKVYVPNKYYVKLNSVYVLSDGEFDASSDYYVLIEGTVDGEEPARELPEPVTYNNITYYKDTKEYRLAKFKNEFDKHFDLEYATVYWVMTEVFLCYDSRGKNAMFASWGPLEEGGDYIWYPLFYDIDTQLGINNTGIPSFEYSVNASLDGCFSTSDSVLWQNLYTCFFDNVKATYHQLRNNIINSINGATQTGPIYTVDHIEKWYLADPVECGHILNNPSDAINMRGDRPLIALNMDEFYKYISICNPRIQYQTRDGSLATDNGTYFYALQGNRGLSRQQFLARRINFIDSWLSEGDYSRSTGTDIHGRIAANNPAQNSDKWIDIGGSANGKDVIQSPYYVMNEENNKPVEENGAPKKTNYLDADIFVNMTPYQKSYVTLGDDNEAFASIEYNNKPVRFEFPSTLANGLKTSGGYPEQLLYLYGASSLKDIGDISRLYWTEFYAVNSPHLSRILIGNDHPNFYNKALKMPNFDAGTQNRGKPLLKEVNLTNVTIDNGQSSINLDFSSSEKLQIFKATGSNINTVEFADGVALHTLYLPETISRLKLIEAKNLTKIITEHRRPTEGSTEQETMQNAISGGFYVPSTDSWVVDKGLYIKGITDDTEKTSTNIGYINIAGGSLGYDSYKLLNKLYILKKQQNSDLKISMTKVEWSPYKLLEDGYKYNPAERTLYYVDNDHYGFIPYSVKYGEFEEEKWRVAVLNGEVYKLDETAKLSYGSLTNINMFKDFINLSNFKNTDDFNNDTPRITGHVYFENTDAPIDESYVRNTLQEKFPGLVFHFSEVNKAYSAKFISMEADGVYTVIGTQKIAPEDIDTSPWFKNPYNIYKAERNNYDFHGWSTINNANGVIEKNRWEEARTDLFSEDRFDYTFYAVFTLHKYEVNYYVGNTKLDVSTTCTYGEHLADISGYLPTYSDNSLGFEERYKFIGWTQSQGVIVVDKESDAKLVNIPNLLAVQDYNFYAVFMKESVYNSPTREDLFAYYQTTFTDPRDPAFTISGYQIAPKPGVSLSGKLTLPVEHEGRPIVSIGGFGRIGGSEPNQPGITHIFWVDPSRCQVREILNSAFQDCRNLAFYQFTTSLRIVYPNAFTNVSRLNPAVSNLNNCRNLLSIGQSSFNNAFRTSSTLSEFKIPGTVIAIEDAAFNYSVFEGGIDKLVIGGIGDPCLLQTVTNRFFAQNERQEFRNVEVYCEGGAPNPRLQTILDNYLLVDIEAGGNVSYLSA